MKKSRSIQSLLLQATLITAVLVATLSCTTKKAIDTKDVAEEHNEAKFNNDNQGIDAQFLVNAAEISMEEISLGKLAYEKGSTSHVRELGKLMQEHHQKSLNDLTALAKKKVISIPKTNTDSGNDAYENLIDKSGSDFDKYYSDLMVNEHKDAIMMFETASTESTDPDIKEWAVTTLPKLRFQLDQALVCQKQCEDM